MSAGFMSNIASIGSDNKLIEGSGKVARLHLPCYLTGFMLDVERMNEMYRMPTVGNSPASYVGRLEQFKSILSEECKEIDDILRPLNDPRGLGISTPISVKAETLVALADLLGDIIVYCASEAKRWGIPIDRVLNIVMQSNFSKLDSNGQPIYDERMKLQKGPNYWKPEPKIAQLLLEYAGENNG